MINISLYKGINQFGRAYKIMTEHDTHAPGSVDQTLIENMIKLCPETVDYLYTEYTPATVLYRKGARPTLERYIEKIDPGWSNEEERIEAIAQFTSDLQQRADTDIDSMVFGGTEEDIIARGSDWCTDVARVGCVLCQVENLPSRMVYLVDTEKAYHGHAIIEAFRSHVWGAVDCVANVIYRHPDGEPASTWDLTNNPHLIEAHYRGSSTYYTNPGQFRGAAVSNYFIWQREDYDYSVSRVNAYNRSVLNMAEKGWPGGLRWLHNEDSNG